MHQLKKHFSNSLLLLLLCLTSCGYLQHFETAQDHFNQAATIENNNRFSQSPSELSPDSYYRLADLHLEEALKKDNKLLQDDVLGYVYSLKSLTSWKLGEYDAATKNALNALQWLPDGNKTGAITSRDVAVMKAMSSLINIEKLNVVVYDSLKTIKEPTVVAYQQFFEEKFWNDRNQSSAILQSSLDRLDAILDQVPPSHEVRNYLLMSQLSGLKTWSDGLDMVFQGCRRCAPSEREKIEAFYDEQEVIFEKEKKKVLRQFADNVAGGAESQVYLYWSFLLGSSED